MPRLRNILASFAAACNALAGLDVTGILPVLSPILPKEIVYLVAIIPSAAAAVVHLLQGAKPATPAGAATLKAITLFLVPAVGALAIMGMSSCALPPGWNLDIQTPHGDFASDDAGNVIVTPKPIVIPGK